MKNFILLILVLFLPACSNLLNTSGKAHYTYSKCETVDGVENCTEIEIFNNKDIKTLSGVLEIDTIKGIIKIKLDESDANASNLAQINANNQSELIGVVKSLVPIPGQ
jgi:hypothetical protein